MYYGILQYLAIKKMNTVISHIDGFKNIMLGKGQESWFHLYVEYKMESNKWINKTNKQKLIDTENSKFVTRGKGVGGMM